MAFLAIGPLFAAEAEKLTAGELAARLAGFRENQSADIRTRLKTDDTILQLRIKERRAEGAADVVYQILWPKDRAGETVYLHQSPDRTTAKTEGKPVEVSGALFGSALALADAIENPYAWSSQRLAGTETIDGIECAILESSPGKNNPSIYGKVRSWIDLRRLVPLRVEKFLPSGELARRFTTTRVVTVDNFQVPANLTVEDLSTARQSELDGSRLQRDAGFTDADFSPSEK